MIEKEKLLTDIYKRLLRERKISQKGLLEDQKIIFQDMVATVKEYAVVDWTDEDACCYEFKILLHKNQNILDDDRTLIEVLGGVRYDLRVFISVLEPYYYMFLEETRYREADNQWLFRTIKLSKQDVAKVIKEVDNCLLSKGYRKLSENDVKMVVPQIETELRELNEANIFDCLFTDVVNLS